VLDGIKRGRLKNDADLYHHVGVPMRLSDVKCRKSKCPEGKKQIKWSDGHGAVNGFNKKNWGGIWI